MFDVVPFSFGKNNFNFFQKIHILRITKNFIIHRPIGEIGIYRREIGVYRRGIGVYRRGIGVYRRGIGVYRREIGLSIVYT